MFIGCDEGRLNSEYLVIGSIWLPNDTVSLLEKAVTDWRVGTHFWEEISLKSIRQNASDFKISKYVEFLDIAFELGIEFKSIVVKKELADKKEYHNNDDKIMQLDFLALLIRNKLKYEFGAVEEEISVLYDSFIDQNKTVTKEMITGLEEKEGGGLEFSIEEISEKVIPKVKTRIESYIDKEIECFSQCTSHICSVVQLADLFAGSVQSRLGGNEAIPGREAVIKCFENKFQHPLGTRTPYTRKDLNIWIWRPPMRD